MSRESAAAKLLQIVDAAKGDGLENAEHVFRGLAEDRLDELCGASGRTYREVIEGHRSDRAAWQEARDLLVSLLDGAK